MNTAKTYLDLSKECWSLTAWVTIFELKQRKTLSASHRKNKKTNTTFLILMFIMKVSPN